MVVPYMVIEVHIGDVGLLVLIHVLKQPSTCQQTREVKTIVGLLTQPLTKAWMLFSPSFCQFLTSLVCFFQTSFSSTIHKLHREHECLLKKVLSFFIHPQFIHSGTAPVTEVAYMDHKCQLSYKDIYVGNDTTVLFSILRMLKASTAQ